MKIGCECGSTIFDYCNVPQKGHLIPDQKWDDVFDAVEDEVIAPLSTSKISEEDAYTKSRHIISEESRLMWQCIDCGRLYIDDLNGELQCYVPASDVTSKQILRGRESST
ncbi:hypothetical protein [Gimesia aquarii]|uniref:Uncharacterized protein n=1 Tax=Gimesia aquarii TaxID=2527964 RepID=A0A517VUD2_9PLAN|nr:hypothetical protein [Gimesia aquarii]QDT96607.1 hypothetical protein V144x_20650 [Gimesia aquarii]